MDTSLLCRTLNCWNGTLEVEAGKFGHLSVRAKWIDGKCIVVAREVAEVTIAGLEHSSA